MMPTDKRADVFFGILQADLIVKVQVQVWIKKGHKNKIIQNFN